MRFGVSLALTDQSVEPAEAAAMVEARGLESLFVTEHTHVPAQAAEFKNGVPDSYLRTLDPLVALTAAASATRSLRLGTGIFLASQHEPLVTAKAIASLDLLSSGRVELGVGAGWVRDELANHGVAFERRFGHLREHVEAMRAIWLNEEASYAGDHVRFERVHSWPKPVQPGGPPVLIGGDGPKVIDRVLAYADGWLPRGPDGLDALLPRVRELHARCADAGRDPLPVTLYNVPLDAASVDACREAGVFRGLIRITSGAADEVERQLDEAAAKVALLV